MLKFTKAEKLSLRSQAEFNEMWLQDRIAEDPSILGLGEVEVVARERRQANAGRLDLLLGDTDGNRRYEVELMLGATDESHIIRCIEYWDIERRRYPAYDHCAVLVAEDITSRFLNVLSLFVGTIPLMVIQLNALRVGEQIVLDFVRVIDRMPLRTDDTTAIEQTPADRNYWLERASSATVELAEKLFKLVKEEAAQDLRLNFLQQYIGLHDGARARNFVSFKPRKKHLNVNAVVDDVPGWVSKLEEAGMSATDKNGYLRLAITAEAAEQNGDLVSTLLREAVRQANR